MDTLQMTLAGGLPGDAGYFIAGTDLYFSAVQIDLGAKSLFTDRMLGVVSFDLQIRFFRVAQVEPSLDSTMVREPLQRSSIHAVAVVFERDSDLWLACRTGRLFDRYSQGCCRGIY